MTKTLRFIHAADVHLGAAIRGLRNVDPAWAARLQDAIPRAFERVVEAALAQEVDFVVLAGDVVDNTRVSYGDYVRLFAAFERLHEAGIPTYIVAGNHDPYTAWARDVDRLPDSVHFLGADGPGFALAFRDGEPLCLIGGRSFYNQVWPVDEGVAAGITREAARAALSARDPRALEAPFAIGVIHTGLDVDVMGKAPAAPEELLAAGMDYWACGHVHTRCVFPNAHEPRIVFSGSVQGRDLKETGDRGCYLVELEKPEASALASTALANVRLQFIPTASIALQRLEVNVSACQTLADVRGLVQTELFHANGRVHCDDLVARVVLTGTTPLHGFLARRDVTEELRRHMNNAHPNYYCDALVDRTFPPGEPVGPRGEGGLFSSVVAEIASDQRDRADVLVNYVQSELVKRGIAVPGSASQRIGDFNDIAERLVLDLLREDEE